MVTHLPQVAAFAQTQLLVTRGLCRSGDRRERHGDRRRSTAGDSRMLAGQDDSATLWPTPTNCWRWGPLKVPLRCEAGLGARETPGPSGHRAACQNVGTNFAGVSVVVRGSNIISRVCPAARNSPSVSSPVGSPHPWAKGLTASSLGQLLSARRLRVTMQNSTPISTSTRGP